MTLVWSSMFVETCVTVLSWSPSARTSSSARTNFAIRLAVASGASISTLKAISGGRAATSVAPAVGWLGWPEVGLEVVQAAGLAELRAGAAAGQLAVQIDGDAELPDLVGEHERLGARGALVGLVEVDDRRHVDGSHARVQALRGASGRRARSPPSTPASTAVCSSPGSPASVNTARWWSGSDERWIRSGPERGRDRVQRRWSRPSETFGTEIEHRRDLALYRSLS